MVKLAVVDDPLVGGLTISERRIRDSGDYVNKRIANLKAGEAWLDVGRELSELKSFLLKQHKGDNTASGWKAAFRKGKTPFSFGRQQAETLIRIHETIGVSGANTKNLPASIRALFELSKLPEPYVAQALAECQPGTTSTEVRKLAKAAGYVAPKKAAPQRDPVEAAHNRHVDLIRNLSAEKRRTEVLAFLADIGVDPKELV